MPRADASATRRGGVAAALGLAVTIVLGVVASRIGTAAEADPLLATVNGRPIHLSDAYAQIERLPLGEQIDLRGRLDRFVESLIQEEVIFQSVLASDFADAPLLRDEVKDLVVRHVLETRVTDRIVVTDAEVSAFYEANPGAIRGEYARVSQIVLAEPAQCEALRNRIGSAQEFAALARERSTDADSADRGGDLGYVMNHAGPLGFEERLFSLEPGQMAIYRTSAGCHLVRVSERVTPAVPPLENVAPRIRGLLARQQEIRLLRELLDEAATRVTVERATD